MIINKNNIEEHIFDYLEGNLSGQELASFKSYISANPEANAELNIWKQTYVTSNTNINSTEFSSLKKSNKKYFWMSGVAAAFLLGFSTMALISDNETTTNDIEINSVVTRPTENIPINNENIIEHPNEIEVDEVEKIEPISNINNDVKIEEQLIDEPVLVKEEQIELATQKGVTIDAVESGRKANLKKIRIKKESALKKKKEVDVIDFETGF